jgi:hypothetical protein
VNLVDISHEKKKIFSAWSAKSMKIKLSRLVGAKRCWSEQRAWSSALN